MYGARFGLKESFMEFLSKQPYYQHNMNLFIVKLVKNYRSHPAILHIPSQLFYSGSLQSQATMGNFRNTKRRYV